VTLRRRMTPQGISEATKADVQWPTRKNVKISG
jgi:hypothetical protein